MFQRLRGLLIAAAAAASVCAPASAQTHAGPAAAVPPSAGRAEDLAVLAGLVDKDPSFSTSERQAAQRLLARLGQGASLSPAAFELAAAELAATADNGHTLLLNPSWSGRYARVPARFLVASDRLYLITAAGPAAAFAGTEVLSVEGRSWPSLRALLRRYQGGLDGWREQFLYAYLESPEILHAAGLAKDPGRLRLQVRDARGRRHRVVVPAGEAGPPPQGFEAFIPASRVLELARDTPDAPFAAPLYLREPRKTFRTEFLPDLRALYVQYRANTNIGPGDDIKAFHAEVSKALKEKTPEHVVVDLRFNFGGDLNLTRDMMQALAAGTPGTVFAITSGRTFSAGIASLGYLKQAGGPKVVIVGEPIGDRLAFWAEGGPVRLPASGAFLLSAAERHDYVTGCPEADCHGPLRRNPIRVSDLDVDHPAGLTFQAFMQGRDPAMETVARLIASRR